MKHASNMYVKICRLVYFGDKFYLPSVYFILVWKTYFETANTPWRRLKYSTHPITESMQLTPIRVFSITFWTFEFCEKLFFMNFKWPKLLWIFSFINYAHLLHYFQCRISRFEISLFLSLLSTVILIVTALCMYVFIFPDFSFQNSISHRIKLQLRKSGNRRF